MPPRKNSLQLALDLGKLSTRPLEEIARDQEETIRWAEEVAKPKIRPKPASKA